MSEMSYTEKLREIATKGPLFEDEEEEIKNDDNSDELNFVNVGIASYIL